MVDGRTVRARVIEQLVVALHARSRQVLPDDVFGERRRGEQTPQELQSADNRAPIGVFGEVARVDRRLVVRVGRAHQDIAARQRPHLPRTAGNARPIVELANEARFVARRREDALHVRRRRLGQNFEKAFSSPYLGLPVTCSVS